MQISSESIELIKHFEGLRLKAYQCSANKWTIGYGSTFYEDGSNVKRGDIITVARANELFIYTVDMFAHQVADLITVDISANKFGALVSLAYNIGIENFRASTILRKVNENPENSNITFQFNRWCMVNGQVIPGLVKRRKAEAALYFKIS